MTYSTHQDRKSPAGSSRSAIPGAALGVPLHEAIQFADKSLVLKPYNEARLREEGGYWSGTLVAYTSPGKKLGEAAVKVGDQHYLAHEALYVPVPESALDAKDVVL